MTAIDSDGLFNSLVSLAAQSGQFDSVIGHEPQSYPGTTNMSAAVWYIGMKPVQSSGLSSVSMVVNFWVRIFTQGSAEPKDRIDPEVMKAADAFFMLVIGKFQLGLPDTRYVDIFGSDSDGMSADGGWLPWEGNSFRTIDIKIPVIVNDVYTEVA